MADKAEAGLKHTVTQVCLRDDDVHHDTRETYGVEMGLEQMFRHLSKQPITRATKEQYCHDFLHVFLVTSNTAVV